MSFYTKQGTPASDTIDFPEPPREAFFLPIGHVMIVPVRPRPCAGAGHDAAEVR